VIVLSTVQLKNEDTTAKEYLPYYNTMD